jgi:hypothetical protein
MMMDVEWYNAVLDAWACAALFQIHIPTHASQRARELLVSMQEQFELHPATAVPPNTESFSIVSHVVGRVEGSWMTRRFLAWREYLYKSGKNTCAQPTRPEYVRTLDAYAHSGQVNAGYLAQGFLRHMKVMQQPPDTLCYNMAIKAWTQSRRGRDSAEQAEQILMQMDTLPDGVTYASVMSAWAASGMKAHAVARVEALLRRMEDTDGLEPNTIVLNAVMSAWVKARHPGAVNRTAEILQQMKQVDIFSYNTHLHALSMHSSKHAEYAERASVFLSQWEKSFDSGKVSFAPNLFSYNLVIEAFCRSTSSNAVQRAADTLRQLVKREGVEPDTFSFNQVLAALAKGSSLAAAKKAEELLHYQDDAYRSGVHPYAKPDITGYSTVIMAYSRSGAKGAADQAEKLLHDLKSRFQAGEADMKPNIICYNALIHCWAKSGEGTLGARKAETLVEEMQELYDAGDESLKPNLVTYNALLNAWAQSGTRCCGRKAETYLDKMWALYNAGDKKVKPNDFSYNTVRIALCFFLLLFYSYFLLNICISFPGDQCHFEKSKHRKSTKGPSTLAPNG